MRPGLVAVGIAFLALGAVTVGASLGEPAASSRTESSTVQWSWSLPPQGQYDSPFLWGLNGSFSISWSSSTVVSATLYAPCVACKSPWTKIDSWANVSRGSWSTQGVPSYPYTVDFTSAVSSATSIAASTQSSTIVPLPPPNALAMIAGTLAGITLVGLGGIAVFLGLFLRRNVFGRPPPLVSQRAEDARAIAEQYPPQPPES
ncbi:MAG: hypothetical protein L3K07_08480 [Thermoplasmata archaeon]|nr:hypothetical protein [Thermoplasmata archaeon]